MDSLTQIVLGAACGEIALGKKIGNKALLFGAIGGTIPDLDVFIGNIFYSNSIDAMTFHRGFMHSLTFAFLGAFIFGYVFFKLSNSGKRLDTTTKKDWTWLFFYPFLPHYWIYIYFHRMNYFPVFIILAKDSGNGLGGLFFLLFIGGLIYSSVHTKNKHALESPFSFDLKKQLTEDNLLNIYICLSAQMIKNDLRDVREKIDYMKKNKVPNSYILIQARYAQKILPDNAYLQSVIDGIYQKVGITFS